MAINLSLEQDEINIQTMAHNSGRCNHPDRDCSKQIGDCAECGVYPTCKNLYIQGYRYAPTILDNVQEYIEDMAIHIENTDLDDIYVDGTIVCDALRTTKSEVTDYYMMHEKDIV